MNGAAVWVVGKKLDAHECAWEFQGVFATEREAAEFAAEHGFFIGPAVIGERVPVASVPAWPGAYYPIPLRRREPDR